MVNLEVSKQLDCGDTESEIPNRIRTFRGRVVPRTDWRRTWRIPTREFHAHKSALQPQGVFGTSATNYLYSHRTSLDVVQLSLLSFDRGKTPLCSRDDERFLHLFSSSDILGTLAKYHETANRYALTIHLEPWLQARQTVQYSTPPLDTGGPLDTPHFLLHFFVFWPEIFHMHCSRTVLTAYKFWAK